MEQVKAVVKRERLKTIEKVQQKILDAKHKSEKGCVVRVVCDAVVNGIARCRTFAQSPEVDPCIYIDVSKQLEPFDVGGEYEITLA